MFRWISRLATQLDLACVKNKTVQIAKIQTSLHLCYRAQYPSPDLACVSSEDLDVFREQIQKLLFKWHLLMVRVVREIEQWMFRKVWAVYTGNVQMASRGIRASSKGFDCRRFHFYLRTVRTQARLQICTRMGVRSRAEICFYLSVSFV